MLRLKGRHERKSATSPEPGSVRSLIGKATLTYQPKPTLLWKTLPRHVPNGLLRMHVRPAAAPMPQMRLP